ncbi:unnamed protein product [Sphagnum jensenii]
MLAQSPLQISSLSFCPRPALVQEKEYHYDCSLLQASCGIISCSCFSQSSSLLSPGRRRKQPVLQPTRSGTGLRTDLLKAVAAAAAVSTGFTGTVPGNTNRADYQSQSATWPDLANSTDFHEFEKIVTPAHALVRTWLALELVSRLERFVYDPLESPAIVIRGLPVDAYAPPTEKDCLLRKAGNCASETLLVGISRIVGQPFQMGYPDPSSSEMEILIRDIYSIPEHDNQVHYSHRRDCVSEFPHVVSCRIPNMSSKP